MAEPWFVFILKNLHVNDDIKANVSQLEIYGGISFLLAQWKAIVMLSVYKMVLSFLMSICPSPSYYEPGKSVFC